MTASATVASDVTDPAGRWSALYRLALGMVLAMTTWFSASAVLPQVRVEWDLSRTAGSWLTIAVQLGFVAGAVTSAALNLADLVPPRRLMLYGALGAAGANTGLLWATGATTAIPLRFATGVCLAGVYPPALKAMATWFRRRRGTALGVMVGALTIGSALPHLVNGSGGVRWETVIVATSLLTVAGGLVVELAGRDGPFPFPTAVFDPSQARRAFADRGVRLATRVLGGRRLGAVLRDRLRARRSALRRHRRHPATGGRLHAHRGHHLAHP